MRITVTDQIPQLVSAVHDYWFNIERVRLDEARRTVAIRFEKRKADLARGSDTGITVVINNAKALTIDDTERVRDYDLNEIQFDSGSCRLIMTGGIPIRIIISVSSLDIEVSAGPAFG